jgi:hypothetical protein
VRLAASPLRRGRSRCDGAGVLFLGTNPGATLASGRGVDENDGVAVKGVWRRSAEVARTWPCRHRVVCTKEHEDD